MFFYLSKILWFFIDPGNTLLLMVAAGALLVLTRFRALGRTLILAALALAILVTFVPVGQWMTASLENRFPLPAALPDNVAGFVVLGGVLDPRQSALRKTPSIGGAVERITVSARLARQHPAAKLIYSGGNGTIGGQEHREADYVSELYGDLGISAPQLVLERDSRNTWENAQNAIELARPKPGETWVLVTSASHMPRAVGVFRRYGWEMLPYPVDYSTDPEGASSPMSFTQGLGQLSHGLHEWIGLSAYWLTGKTGSAFPKPLTAER